MSDAALSALLRGRKQTVEEPLPHDLSDGDDDDDDLLKTPTLSDDSDNEAAVPQKELKPQVPPSAPVEPQVPVPAPGPAPAVVAVAAPAKSAAVVVETSPESANKDTPHDDIPPPRTETQEAPAAAAAARSPPPAAEATRSPPQAEERVTSTAPVAVTIAVVPPAVPAAAPTAVVPPPPPKKQAPPRTSSPAAAPHQASTPRVTPPEHPRAPTVAPPAQAQALPTSAVVHGRISDILRKSAVPSHSERPAKFKKPSPTKQQGEKRLSVAPVEFREEGRAPVPSALPHSTAAFAASATRAKCPPTLADRQAFVFSPTTVVAVDSKGPSYVSLFQQARKQSFPPCAPMGRPERTRPLSSTEMRDNVERLTKLALQAECHSLRALSKRDTKRQFTADDSLRTSPRSYESQTSPRRSELTATRSVPPREQLYSSFARHPGKDRVPEEEPTAIVPQAALLTLARHPEIIDALLVLQRAAIQSQPAQATQAPRPRSGRPAQHPQERKMPRAKSMTPRSVSVETQTETPRPTCHNQGNQGDCWTRLYSQGLRDQQRLRNSK
eukprot:TRINITY_DN7342_c0_g2_i1.p1 TRINITY_DN7342_c0_g2~~TRINITY_DN7342_c0_g2_i1.p1  ORF type:complete len:561 (+),score=72.94 TRINITY_DN7342_c0_g2_i1:22-1683(+)